MKLGFVTSSIYLRSEQSAFLALFRRCQSDIRQLSVQLHVLGQTYDAMARHGLLSNCHGLRRYHPNDRHGGLVSMAAAIIDNESSMLDGIVYLAPRDDPATLLPEVLALKRQCLIYAKPFLSTAASFVDWLETESILAGHPPRPKALSPDSRASTQTVALIAHDGMKDAMVAFVGTHFDVLSRFGRRVSTASTGSQLNELARERGWPPKPAWTSCYRSGPLGGDLEIANLVNRHQCQRVIFFRDPLVAHAHNADIDTLERAIVGNTDDTVYIGSPAMASRWAEAADKASYVSQR